MRSHSDVSFKHLPEVEGILKSDLVGHLFDGISALRKKLFCFVYAKIRHIILEFLPVSRLKIRLKCAVLMHRWSLSVLSEISLP